MKEAVLETLEKSGLDAALICFDNLADKRQRVKLKVAFANEVKHLMPEDSKSALEVAERYAKGLATDVELASAAFVAYAVCSGNFSYAANAALSATRYVLTAASSSSATSWAAASAAAWANVLDFDADDAVRKKMQAKQTEILKQFLGDAE